MAIADTIQSMYDNVGNVYDVLELAGADLTNVDKNIVNLKLTWQERLLYFINNGTDVVWNNWEKVTGEGETLTLNSTEEAPMKINLKGNTSQETNLYNGEIEQGTWGQDGAIDSQTRIRTKDYIIVVANTTIPISFSGADEYYALFYNSSKSYIGQSVTWKTSGTDLEVIENASYIRMSFRKSNNSNITPSEITNLQVGSVPNPDYPQAIHVVSGDNSIKVEGKNLFNVENGTRTYGGQTYSIEDNIFKFSSTTVSGGVSAGVITPYTSYSFDTSSSYVWSLNKKSGNWTKGSAYPRVLIYIKYSDNTTSYSQINLNTDNQESASNTITFTSGKIPVSFAFGIYAPNGSLSNNVSAEYYVQLEKGSTATTYEPYQGNTYNIDLGVENLWDTSKLQSGFLNQSGSYPTTNPSYPNARYRLVYLYKGQSITTYKSTTYGDFRIRYIDVDTNLIVGTIAIGDNNGYASSNVTYQGSFNNGTITALKDVILGLFDFSGNLAEATITYGTKIQTITDNPIELCKIGDYQDSIKKSTGKNLFDKDNLIANYRLGSDGTPFYQSGYSLTEYISVEPNTTYCRNIAFVTNEPVCLYDSSKTFISRITTGSSFTTTSETKYIRTAVSTDKINITQLEKGSSVSDYEPYGTSWYLNKQIGKVGLDGSEDWATAITRTSYNKVVRQFSLNNAISNQGSSSNITKSTHFGSESADNIYSNSATGINCMGISSSGYLRVGLDLTVFSNDSSFKTWLSTHNTTVYYVLATPTYTEITDSTLISQLEALNGAKSYTTQTNISQENNDKPFILDVTALKQLTQ